MDELSSEAIPSLLTSLLPSQMIYLAREREVFIGPGMERLDRKNVIEIGTEASKVLISGLESGAFVLEALEEGVATFSGFMTGIDEPVSERRGESIVGHHYGGDFDTEFGSEALGKRATVVLVVV